MLKIDAIAGQCDYTAIGSHISNPSQGMNLYLKIPAPFFLSEYVPRLSLFSGRSKRLGVYRWNWGSHLVIGLSEAEGKALLFSVPIPCAGNDAVLWLLKRTALMFAAVLLGCLGLGLGLVVIAIYGVGADISLVGIFVSLILLLLAWYCTRLSQTGVLQIHAHMDGRSLIIAWPENQLAIYHAYQQAVTAWERDGEPLPAPKEVHNCVEDAFAEQIPPGWDEAGGTRADPTPNSRAQ